MKKFKVGDQVTYSQSFKDYALRDKDAGWLSIIAVPHRRGRIVEVDSDIIDGKYPYRIMWEWKSTERSEIRGYLHNEHELSKYYPIVHCPECGKEFELQKDYLCERCRVTCP